MLIDSFTWLTRKYCVSWVLDARWLSLCSLPPATYTGSKWKRCHLQASNDFIVNARLPPYYTEFRDSWSPYLGKEKDCDSITFNFSRVRRKMSTKGSDRKKKFKFLSLEVCGHGLSKQPQVWASVSASSVLLWFDRELSPSRILPDAGLSRRMVPSQYPPSPRNVLLSTSHSGPP